MDIITFFDEFDSSSSEEEDNVVCIAYQRLMSMHNTSIPKPVTTRQYLNRQREATHERLFNDYFADEPLYGDDVFATRFRMSKQLLLRIVHDMEQNYEYFRLRYDARGRRSFTALQKCTSAIRQMAYEVPPDAVDEYLQMSAKTSRESLHEFCKSIIDFYHRRYMRRPTLSDVHALYAHHEAVHGFPSMMGSIDCTHWDWRNCPTAWRGQYMRGTNNDLNVIRQSPVFNAIINKTAPMVPFMVNEIEYKHGYYLGDGIYPQWVVIVKTLTCPHSVERQRFKSAQEAARKDVERTFGGLKGKCGIVQRAARAMHPRKIRCIMYGACILHNMIIEDEGNAICTFHENELSDPNVDPPRNFAIIDEIQSRRTHLNLQKDLIEHIAHTHIPNIDG